MKIFMWVREREKGREEISYFVLVWSGSLSEDLSMNEYVIK